MRTTVYVHALHCGVMRLFKWWRFARVASLLAMALLLCVGPFLSLPPTGLEVPAALTRTHSSHVNQKTNGGWPPLDGSYLAVPPEETEEVGKQSPDAYLLTALLLAVSFGATVVLLLTNGRGQGGLRSLGIDRRRWLHSFLEARPFLGVFRL